MFKRKSSGRKAEAKKAKKIFNTDNINPINKRLGISSNAPKEKIVYELNKIKGNKRLLKQLSITESDLIRYGL